MIFKTVHIPGKYHCGPDALSRLCETDDINCVDEMNVSFLDNMFEFSEMKEWHDEIASDPQLSNLIEKGAIICVDDVYVKRDENHIIVVPKSVRQNVLKFLHDNYGHQGMNKLLYRVKERYYWPNLNLDIRTFCKSCHSCAVNKDNRPPNSAPLLSMSTSTLELFQRVAIDILGPLPEATDDLKYLFVLQDYFTKWPEAVALKSVDSDSVQNWLSIDIIPRFGVFSELVTDQGVQFCSEKFKSFCKSVGIKQKFTSPFHPQTDGMVEKFNRTFLNMIRNYVSENQTDWPDHIPLIMFSYRTAINDSIGVTPAEALQGRKIKLPTDMLRPDSLQFDNPNTLEELFTKRKIIRSKVRDNAEKSLAKRQRDYDTCKTRNIKESFKAGDLVHWKKPIAKKGHSPKLSQIWQGPFTVKHKLSDLNYVLCDDKNSTVTVHVKNLKFCNDVSCKPVRIRTRGRPRKEKH